MLYRDGGGNWHVGSSERIADCSASDGIIDDNKNLCAPDGSVEDCVGRCYYSPDGAGCAGKWVEGVDGRSKPAKVPDLKVTAGD